MGLFGWNKPITVTFCKRFVDQCVYYLLLLPLNVAVNTLLCFGAVPADVVGSLMSLGEFTSALAFALASASAKACFEQQLTVTVTVNANGVIAGNVRSWLSSFTLLPSCIYTISIPISIPICIFSFLLAFPRNLHAHSHTKRKKELK